MVLTSKSSKLRILTVPCDGFEVKINISLYLYISIYLCISISLYLYISISLYPSICLYLSISVYLYISLYISISLHLHIQKNDLEVSLVDRRHESDFVLIDLRKGHLISGPCFCYEMRVPRSIYTCIHTCTYMMI